MPLIDVNEFTREEECIYDEERYSVRDNGAVFRHPRLGKRVRPNDNQWTFGIENTLNPYLHISNVRIHRIVATAFHGEPPNPQYIVDHIDTNCRNNRPENLRWLTRLENVLLNPVTRKKIESICGSIEAFLENPSILNAYRDLKDIAWMRTVTPEEATNCKKRMSLWAESDIKPSGGSFGEWVYKPINELESTSKKATTETVSSKEKPKTSEKYLNLRKQIHERLMERRMDRLNHLVVTQSDLYNHDVELVNALTNNCAQKNWRVPSYFPCCPDEIGGDPLESYFRNLKIGAVFSYNDKYPKSTIFEFVKAMDNLSILVLCEKENLKPWSVTKITFENNLFVHTSLGSYFEKNGADKTFCIEQGLKWTGGETFDDFC